MQDEVFGSLCNAIVVEALAEKDCIEVSCGGLHTIVVTKDAQIFAFGDGGDGQLGLGQAKMNDVFLPEPVKIPELAAQTAQVVSQ